jgi:hypothetical protein
MINLSTDDNATCSLVKTESAAHLAFTYQALTDCVVTTVVSHLA